VTTLSIVVPVLNEAANLERLLPDLLARGPDVEIVVADAGSTDGTAALVRQCPSVTLVDGPRGRARQMNAGARASRGDALLFLHADTGLPPGAIAAIARALADPSIVGGRFDVRFTSPRWPFRLIAALMNWRSRWSGIATGDQGIFVRRASFEALGGYRDIPLMEDIELTRRLKRLGRMACLDARVTTSSRKWEREGIARTILLMWTLRLLYFVGVSPARLVGWYYR